jgi:hypothetical protein
VVITTVSLCILLYSFFHFLLPLFFFRCLSFLRSFLFLLSALILLFLIVSVFLHLDDDDDLGFGIV